jgi:RHS repeat-associated protein
MRPRSWLGAVSATALLLTMAPAPAPAPATAASDPYRPRALAAVKPIAVAPVKPAAAAKVTTPAPMSRPSPVWPAAGVARAGTGLVAEAGAALGVTVMDRATTARAGVRGVLMRVQRAGRLSLSYDAFRGAYGAGWESRLRLVRLPECALSTPDAAECGPTPLVSDNNLIRGTVAADVSSGLVALAAAPSGPMGSFAATSLEASSTWSAGGNSGGFTWSYPMAVPPSPAGLVPAVAVSYSSQSVDGKHAASNNQPSWVGEGFEAWPGGFIERSYANCGNDRDTPGHNNTVKTGDQCWETDNAALSLGKHSGELIYNATEGRWHLRADDGTRVTRATSSANNNGDNDGEHWIVTTPDGTQYFFGLNRLPGWTSGKSETSSTWTAHVAGNDPNEPCRAATFVASFCKQAWRWNLDYVVDLRGNSASYWYSKETNTYARNITRTDVVQYDRGGKLDKIAYGTRKTGSTDSIFTTAAPAQVLFGVADRCVIGGCTTHDKAHWPDTPWDQECTGSPCDTFSATYWSTRRLSTVTTQVRSGSTYIDVDRWTFTHSFPDPGDSETAGLWLDKIAHEGRLGTTTTMPDIVFTGAPMDNRVDGIDHSSAMAWLRLVRIDTESGGAVAITYSGRDCQPGQTKPTPETNTRLCYPARWTPEGFDDPLTDWFHKYVVTDVREVDMVGGQPEIHHHYDYLGTPAWHYTDDDGIIQPKDKTWSVWRGYSSVGVTTGEGSDRTYSETKYFRGMHGDRLNVGGGTKSVNVDGIADEDWHAGTVRQTKNLNGPSGALVSRVVNEPWASAVTATRTVNGDRVEARFTRIATVRDYTMLDAGRGERVTRTTTTFDAYGLAVKVDDYGNENATGDEQCSTTGYEPRNLTAWILAKPHRAQTFAVSCAAAANQAALTEADVMADVRTSYDGQAWGTTPTRGEVTATATASEWNAGSPTYVTTATHVYDSYGRVTEVRDALNNKTTTEYLTSATGAVSGTKVTNPLGHYTTTTVDARGNQVKTVDPNTHTTELAYDGLGRLTAVWTPGRSRSGPATVTYAYTMRSSGGVSSVTTNRRNTADTGWNTSYSLLDGLLRPLQTQAPSPTAGGRILTNTFYDTAGRAKLNYGAYFATGTPGTSLHVPIEPLGVPQQSLSIYDGVGRVTNSIFRPYAVERWRTTNTYSGDRIDIKPPTGATATSTVADARGRNVELWQYKGAVPTPSTPGSYDKLTYTYNRKGQMTRVTDTVGNKWEFTYDLRGRKLTTSDPDKGTITSTYDDLDRLSTTTDARGIKLVYTYDALSRKTAVYQNFALGTPRVRWTYDTAAKGYLDQSIRNAGTQTWAIRTTGYTPTYQPTGHDISVPPEVTGVGTYSYSYTYHPDGGLASVTLPAVGGLPQETISTEYDALGQPSAMRAVLGTTNLSYVTSAHYDALGNRDRTILDTGPSPQVNLQRTTEPETGRLANLYASRETGPAYTLMDVTYGHDNAGNIVAARDVATGDNQCYSYDYLRRMTSAWTPATAPCSTAPTAGALGGPAPYWLAWTYDAVGNRKSQTSTPPSGTATTTTYNYPAPGAVRPHAVTSTTAGSYTYDSVGNTLTRPAAGGAGTLTWDVEGHLATSSENGGTSYVYDAEGNRVLTTDSGGKTLYLPSQEVRITSGGQVATRHYTFAESTVASRTPADLTWLVDDHQGTQGLSINATTQAVTQRRQTPFGASRGAPVTWPNTRGFVGGIVDKSGLKHLGAREYDSDIGRFVSVDPMLDVSDPQQLNGYSYANNSPVTGSDPSGLMHEPGGGGGGGGGGCSGMSVTACEHRNGTDIGYGTAPPAPPKTRPGDGKSPRGPGSSGSCRGMSVTACEHKKGWDKGYGTKPPRITCGSWSILCPTYKPPPPPPCYFAFQCPTKPTVPLMPPGADPLARSDDPDFQALMKLAPDYRVWEMTTVKATTTYERRVVGYQKVLRVGPGKCIYIGGICVSTQEVWTENVPIYQSVPRTVKTATVTGYIVTKTGQVYWFTGPSMAKEDGRAKRFGWYIKPPEPGKKEEPISGAIVGVYNGGGKSIGIEFGKGGEIAFEYGTSTEKHPSVDAYYVLKFKQGDLTPEEIDNITQGEQ